MNTRAFGLSVVAGISLFAAGCGGGGGGGGAAPSSAPAQVLLTPGSRQLTVGWSPVAGASSYNIYVASAPGVNNLNYGLMPDGLHVPRRLRARSP